MTASITTSKSKLTEARDVADNVSIDPCSFTYRKYHIKYSCVKCAYIIDHTVCNNRFIMWTWNERYSSASDTL